MKKCLIIENSFKEDSFAIGREIDEFLSMRNIETSHFVIAEDSKKTKIDSVPFRGNDFVITLGGDGTVLFAARGSAPWNIPVFPVNLGLFGFIAGVQRNSWRSDLDLFIEGKLEAVGRNMIQVDVFRNKKKIFSSNSLNDVVLTSLLHVQMLSFDVVYNKSLLGHFKADGIIVATATGSTAYSVSAGGPIVDPELDAFVLTSINSFSLSVRPLVFNPEGKLSITMLPWRNNSVRAVIDGQDAVELTADDTVVITKSPHKALLVGCTIGNFYEALRSKLNWAGGPHA
ncbi:NAD(+)/NADH kinase [Treponema parvum]|uniref:NAD kinase n=1 Tax=Treponema parvum TaxID=138851 RepID=A0A975ICM9_9SPIR|nr:NAD(+)/NADH kinase [Treponema parvum]QTQ12090.1 NAD(+)/NADH kinase [Treponema parvum]QTQ15934.1 NAD(+)/NADH kinase [Treponema parvum]